MTGKLIRFQVSSRPRPAGSCLEGSDLFFHPKEGGNMQTTPADGWGFTN